MTTPTVSFGGLGNGFDYSQVVNALVQAASGPLQPVYANAKYPFQLSRRTTPLYQRNYSLFRAQRAP